MSNSPYWSIASRKASIFVLCTLMYPQYQEAKSCVEGVFCQYLLNIRQSVITVLYILSEKFSTFTSKYINILVYFLYTKGIVKRILRTFVLFYLFKNFTLLFKFHQIFSNLFNWSVKNCESSETLPYLANYLISLSILGMLAEDTRLLRSETKT